LLYYAEFVDYKRLQSSSSSSNDRIDGQERDDLAVHEIDDFLIGMSCVFLASKTTERLCKLRTLVTVAHSLLNYKKNKEDDREKGDRENDEKEKAEVDKEEVEMLEVGPEYWMLRDSVITCELLLARIIAFDFHVELPYAFLMHATSHLLNNDRAMVKGLFAGSDDKEAFYEFQWEIVRDAVAIINDW
jgi:hypothetical protein